MQSVKSVDKGIFTLTLLLVLGCRGPKPTDTPPKPPDPPPAAPMTRVTPHHSTDPALTPDETWLLFATRAYSQSYDLYRKRVDGKTDTLVVASPGDERFPAVAPNGRGLAFCSTRDGFVGIYWIEDFTGPADDWALISSPHHQSVHPSWSPDGRFIVYSATAEKDWTNAQLLLYEPRTQTTHALGIHGLFPSWAPQGNRVVYQKMRGRDEFLGGLWCVELEGTEVAAETRIFDMTEFAAINARWSPDAQHVIFAVTRPDADASMQTARDLGVVSIDGAQFWRLTEDEAPDWLPIWSKHATIYFVSERDGPPAIWSMAEPTP